MNLASLLKERIQAHGPLDVADYMDACVAHYYAHQQPFGTEGDFITAPELSPAFGEILGAWLVDQWEQQGKPPAFALLELGPGRGMLMGDVMRMARIRPEFLIGAQVMFLESSPALRAIQKQAVPCHHIDTIKDLPPLPLFFLANEFFDALPIHQEVLVDGAWVKRHVGLDAHGNLAFLESGPIRETCPQAQTYGQALAHHLATHGGAGVIIDYGYGQGETGDTLQAVRRHAYHPVLEAPGQADLTAHVDFQALAHPFSKQGLRAHLWTQGDFLRAHGIALRATPAACHRLTSPDQMGTLFKVLTVMV